LSSNTVEENSEISVNHRFWAKKLEFDVYPKNITEVISFLQEKSDLNQILNLQDCRNLT
jgi:hypothetical protein